MQQRVYDLRPDLKPSFLGESSEHPESNRTLGRALVEAGHLDDEGQSNAAIAVLESYQAAEPLAHHRAIAQAAIERLREKRGQ
jgi:hypothetical protein